MLNQLHGYETPDDVITNCPNPHCIQGWVEYEADELGFAAPQWGRCGECVDGEIVKEGESNGTE